MEEGRSAFKILSDKPTGRSAFKILTDKPTGKRPSGRPRRKWEDNIRMDLEEIGINTRNWLNFY